MAVAAMTVLAHQGQWDEVLLVAIPLALFAWALHLANRRADRAHEQHRPPTAPDPAVTPTAVESSSAAKPPPLTPDER